MLSYDYFSAALTAIDLISQGKTKTHACDDSGISIPQFEKYVNANKELQELLHEAETRGYDAMADALLRIDHHAIYGHSDPKMAKVMSDNIKWLLSKRKQREYGDRLEVTHNVTVDKAITDALSAGRRRAEQRALEAPTIDAEFTVVDDPLAHDPSDEEIMSLILA